jgi:hypothetical protein
MREGIRYCSIHRSLALVVRGHMGADDATPLIRDMYQTAKDIDAVIEDLQQLMDKIYELARAAGQAPCVGIDFSIYFSARIHAMPVNRLYSLARSLCRDLSPDGCRNHSDLVEMLALRIEPLPDPSVTVEEAAAKTICDIISEIFMPFVEGGIACLLVCDPTRADLSPQAHAGALPPLHASLCYIVMFILCGCQTRPRLTSKPSDVLPLTLVSRLQLPSRRGALSPLTRLKRMVVLNTSMRLQVLCCATATGCSRRLFGYCAPLDGSLLAMLALRPTTASRSWHELALYRVHYRVTLTWPCIWLKLTRFGSTSIPIFQLRYNPALCQSPCFLACQMRFCGCSV